MDEDDLPSFLATPEEEVEFWRTHDINGKRLPPRKPIEFKRPEPDLRVAPRTPAPDLDGGMSYQEWKDGRDKCPALYWDPYLAVQQLMGRAYTPIRWR
jgi:hypothetical protein